MHCRGRFSQNGNFLHNCAAITALEIMVAARSVGLEMLYIAANVFAYHIVLKISKHTSKQQHKLINKLVGWMYSTVPCSLNALYILYNNWHYNSHPYRSTNGKRIENQKEYLFIFMVKGPYCDRSKVYFYAGGTHTPKPNTLETAKKQSMQMVELSLSLFISMPANYFGQM